MKMKLTNNMQKKISIRNDGIIFLKTNRKAGSKNFYKIISLGSINEIPCSTLADYIPVINEKYRLAGKNCFFQGCISRHKVHPSFTATYPKAADYKPYPPELGLDQRGMLFFQLQLCRALGLQANDYRLANVIKNQELCWQILNPHWNRLLSQLPDNSQEKLGSYREKMKDVWQCFQQYYAGCIQSNYAPQLELRYTKAHGWGVYAAEDIPGGAFIGIYAGEILTRAVFYADKSLDYQPAYTADIKNPNFIINAEAYGNFTRFLNHEDQNSEKCNVFWFYTRVAGLPYLAFIAWQDIPKGQELLWDYGAKLV